MTGLARKQFLWRRSSPHFLLPGFSFVIGACEKASAWEHALALLFWSKADRAVTAAFDPPSVLGCKKLTQLLERHLSSAAAAAGGSVGYGMWCSSECLQERSVGDARDLRKFGCQNGTNYLGYFLSYHANSAATPFLRCLMFFTTFIDAKCVF